MSSAFKNVFVVAMVAVFSMALPAISHAAVDDLNLVSWPDEFLPPGLDYAGSQSPDISSNGRFVAFTANYKLDASTTASDVFVRDMTTGETELVSRASGVDGDIGDSDSNNVRLSSDGRYAVFVSWSTNLTGDATGNGPGVFLRDLQNHTTTLVATNDTNDVGDVSVSTDGRYVAYLPDVGGFSNVNVRDRLSATTIIANREDGVDGARTLALNTASKLSDDGRYIVFTGQLPGGSGVFRRDIQMGATVRVNRQTGVDGAPFNSILVNEPALSGDGRYAAFSVPGLNFSGLMQVYRRDVANGTTEMVSRASGANGDKGNGWSQAAALSADGNIVAFISDSTNLTPNTTTYDQVFARNMSTQTTSLVSKTTGPSGEASEDGSREPVVSGDGKYVAFYSNSENLSEDDSFTQPDVFRRDIGGGSTPSIDGPTHAGPASHENNGTIYSQTPTPGTTGGIMARPEAPKIIIAGRGFIKLKRRIVLTAQCTANPCQIRARARLTINGRNVGSLKLTSTKYLNAGRRSFTYKLSSSAFRKARSALRKGKKISVSFALVANAPGAPAGKTSAQILLKR